MRRDGLLRRAAALGAPIAAQGLAASALALVDTLWIGALGVAALAATALVAKLHFVGLMLASAVANTLTVRVAQACGAGDGAALPGLRRAGALAGALLLAPLALLQFAAPQAIAQLLSPDAAVQELAAVWLRGSAAFLPLSAATLGLAASLRGAGDTRTPLRASIVALVANSAALLLWLGLGPADPARGVAGAALIQSAARALELALLLRAAPLARGGGWPLAPLLALAAPVLANELLWAGGRFVHELVLARTGTAALAAWAVASQVKSLATVVFSALAVATGILVAQELGAQRLARAARIGRALARRVAGVTALAGALAASAALLARPWLGEGFARDVLLVLGLLLPSLGLKAWNTMLCLGLLRSAHDGAYTLRVEVIAMWCVGVPLTAAAALWWRWPLAAVLLVMMSEDVTKALLYRHRLGRGRWTRRWQRLSAPPPALARATGP